MCLQAVQICNKQGCVLTYINDDHDDEALNFKIKYKIVQYCARKIEIHQDGGKIKSQKNVKLKLM